ncbi:MAG: hypothetical protein HY422_00470 [Candidatus Komeilibacteria bacterium]|nr:hypothetical protein [Candidatus Komeilibacteria bacterium]
MRIRFNSYFLSLYGGIVAVFLIALAGAFWMAASLPRATGYASFGNRCVVDTDCTCTSGIPDACGKPGKYPGCVEERCGFKTDIFIPREQLSTADWQTYRNEEYGFDIQYPSDWQITDDFFDKAVAVSISTRSNFAYAVTISVLENPQRLSAKEFVQYSLQETKEQAVREDIQPPAFEKEFALPVGNLEAYELYNVFGYDAGYEIIYIADQDRIYLISFETPESPNVEEPQKNNAIAHQMLSTFKLIEPQNSLYEYEYLTPEEAAKIRPLNNK